jgi:hypothetical protein
MQHGGFDINDYFPGGSADLDSIERDLQGFTPVQSNQINTELTREIRGLRADLKKSDRRNIILGAISLISVVITLISIIITSISITKITC